MDHLIDSLGDICPIPIIKIERKLKDAEVSDRIVLESDHSCSTSSVVNYLLLRWIKLKKAVKVIGPWVFLCWLLWLSIFCVD